MDQFNRTLAIDSPFQTFAVRLLVQFIDSSNTASGCQREKTRNYKAQDAAEASDNKMARMDLDDTVHADLCCG